jgi:hypothetical protein
VNVVGGGGAAYVPSFSASDADADVRLGLRVLNPRVYIGVGYLCRWTNYGYPKMNNVGFGIEKLPDLNIPLSLFGSFWYYPNIKGTYATGLPLAYALYKYQLGLDYVFGKSPIFLDLGWIGDALNNKQNAPANSTAQGPFVGLGVKF